MGRRLSNSLVQGVERGRLIYEGRDVGDDAQGVRCDTQGRVGGGRPPGPLRGRPTGMDLATDEASEVRLPDGASF